MQEACRLQLMEVALGIAESHVGFASEEAMSEMICGENWHTDLPDVYSANVGRKALGIRYLAVRGPARPVLAIDVPAIKLAMMAFERVYAETQLVMIAMGGGGVKEVRKAAAAARATATALAQPLAAVDLPLQLILVNPDGGRMPGPRTLLELAMSLLVPPANKFDSVYCQLSGAYSVLPNNAPSFKATSTPAFDRSDLTKEIGRAHV